MLSYNIHPAIAHAAYNAPLVTARIKTACALPLTLGQDVLLIYKIHFALRSFSPEFLEYYACDFKPSELKSGLFGVMENVVICRKMSKQNINWN